MPDRHVEDQVHGPNPARCCGSKCIWLFILILLAPHAVKAQEQTSPKAPVPAVMAASGCTDALYGCPEPSLPIEPVHPTPSDKPQKGNVISRWDERAISRGIDPHLVLKTEVTGALFGSNGPLKVDARNLLELNATVDLKKVAHWDGARLYGSLHSFVGGNGSDEILLDAQGFSNIDAAEGTHLYELWLLQSLWEGRVQLKGGQIDANTDFAFVESATAFLNSSMGYSPAIAALPTYPNPRIGGEVLLKPKGFYYLSSGVFQDHPNGVMSLNEGGVRWKWRGRAARVAYGYWIHTQRYREVGVDAHQGAQGSYVVAEQQLWMKEEVAGAERGMAVFFQYGTADPWSTNMSRHVGFGMQWTGPWEKRPLDLTGVGVSMVHLEPRLLERIQPGYDYERTYEAFYRLQLSKWLSLTFDGQTINRPNGDPKCAMAMGGTVRSTITF